MIDDGLPNDPDMNEVMNRIEFDIWTGRQFAIFCCSTIAFLFFVAVTMIDFYVVVRIFNIMITSMITYLGINFVVAGFRAIKRRNQTSESAN